MDQIDLDLLELEEKESVCLFSFTDQNGMVKTPATMTWTDMGIDSDAKLEALSHWWEIKKEDFRGLMVNKARSNGITLEAQLETQYDYYIQEEELLRSTHLTKFTKKETSCN